MRIQESAENYLETILILSRRMAHVRSIDIANEMSFSKPSVSIAMRNLRDNGMIRTDDNGHLHLTDAGREIAEHIYERHTIISQWLMYLGVDAAVALEDACRIEHVLSPESFQAIKQHVTSQRELPEPDGSVTNRFG